MEEIALTVYDPNSSCCETFTVNICSSWNASCDDSCTETNLIVPLPSTEEEEANIKEHSPLVVVSTCEGNEPEKRKRKRTNSTIHHQKKKHKSKEERDIGPNCGCFRKCYERIGEETIQKTFSEFWALSNYNSQNAYLLGRISMIGVKRRYTKNEFSRRNFTVTYYIKKGGFDLIVCKTAFLNIHGLQRKQAQIKNLLNFMKNGEPLRTIPDGRGRHNIRPYSQEAIDHVRQYLIHCSNLLRNTATTVKTELASKHYYELYVNTYCQENKLTPVSLAKFRSIVNANEY